MYTTNMNALSKIANNIFKHQVVVCNILVISISFSTVCKSDGVMFSFYFFSVLHEYKCETIFDKLRFLSYKIFCDAYD